MSTQSQVLEFLEKQTGKSVSGEQLAGMLGVTRASIWKAVNALKKEGYQIEAVTNKGYVLSPNSDVVSAAGIKKYLKHPSLSEKIQVFSLVDSTNNVGKQLALQKAEDGTVVIANEQSAGKGRRGRSFYSPPGCGIYLSILNRPDLSTDDAVLITTATSVAVCRAIETVTGKKIEIKWVNDLFESGKKICGILTEAVSDFESGRIECVVIGIGVNFVLAQLPDELKNIVGALYESKPEHISRNMLVAEIINQMSDLNDMIRTRNYIEEYKKRSLVLGKQIRILGEREELADAVDIDRSGGLVVKKIDGRQDVLRSGEISIRLNVPARRESENGTI